MKVTPFSIFHICNKINVKVHHQNLFPFPSKVAILSVVPRHRYPAKSFSKLLRKSKGFTYLKNIFCKCLIMCALYPNQNEYALLSLYIYVVYFVLSKFNHFTTLYISLESNFNIMILSLHTQDIIINNVFLMLFNFYCYMSK